MRRETFYADRNRSGNQMRIETDGCVVSITVGNQHLGGEPATIVEVSTDHEDRGGDINGRVWHSSGTVPADGKGCRIVVARQPEASELCTTFGGPHGSHGRCPGIDFPEARECEGCGAEPGERCRPGCLGEADQLELEASQRSLSATTRFAAHFTPEAWVGDQATEVPPLGQADWDCTGYAIANVAYIRKLEAMNPDDVTSPDGMIDNDDVFKTDPAAPAWVQAWLGPFTIRITRSAAR